MNEYDQAIAVGVIIACGLAAVAIHFLDLLERLERRR
jgi:hypothetical protein